MRNVRVSRVIGGPVKGAISKASGIDFSAPGGLVEYCEFVVENEAVLQQLVCHYNPSVGNEHQRQPLFSTACHIS
jgi:hypothetical protein